VYVLRGDKVQMDSAAWMQEQVISLVQRRVDLIWDRLEQEAYALMDMGVPAECLIRLIHADGRQEIVPNRTDWVGA